MVTFKLDVTDMLDQFNDLASSMNYLIAKSANDTAFQDTRKEAGRSMESELIIRSKNISKPYMFQIDRANKNKLEISIKHRVLGVGYQQFGGTETPDGKNLAIPNRESMQRNLNISNNSLIPKKFRTPNIMSKAKKIGNKHPIAIIGKDKFIIKDTGIFIVKGRTMDSIYNFVNSASHSDKSFNLQEIMIKSFNKRFYRRFNVNYLRQLKKGG